MQARLAASRLAAAGIPSWIPESSMASICWHYAKALGGIRLQVKTDDAEDARVILDEPPCEMAEPILGGTDALADRALRASIFGFLATIPLTLYAGWLLTLLATSSAPVGGAARKKVIHAVILMLPFLAALAAWGALQ